MSQRGIIQKIADECGVDQATVRRDLKAANVDAKNLNFETVVQIVRAVADSNRVLGHAANGRGEGGDASFNEIAAANAEHKRLQTEKIRISNAKALGKLVDREAVTQTGIRIIAEARTALVTVGYRAAPKLVGKTDPAEIAGIIESEIIACLGELSDDTAFLARVLDDEALS